LHWDIRAKHFTDETSTETKLPDRVKDCPPGYPKLANFLDSHKNFINDRGFGCLQSKVLFNKQDQLRDLERQLDELGKEDEDNSARDHKLSVDLARDEVHERTRVELLKEIEKISKNTVCHLAKRRRSFLGLSNVLFLLS